MKKNKRVSRVSYEIMREEREICWEKGLNTHATTDFYTFLSDASTYGKHESTHADAFRPINENRYSTRRPHQGVSRPKQQKNSNFLFHKNHFVHIVTKILHTHISHIHTH